MKILSVIKLSWDNMKIQCDHSIKAGRSDLIVLDKKTNACTTVAEEEGKKEK